MTRKEQMKLAIRILDPVVSCRSPHLKDVKALKAIVPEHIRHWAADDLAVYLVKSLTTSGTKWSRLRKNGRDNSASIATARSILRACTRPTRSDSRARSHELRLSNHVPGT